MDFLERKITTPGGLSLYLTLVDDHLLYVQSNERRFREIFGADILPVPLKDEEKAFKVLSKVQGSFLPEARDILTYTIRMSEDWKTV